MGNAWGLDCFCWFCKIFSIFLMQNMGVRAFSDLLNTKFELLGVWHTSASCQRTFIEICDDLRVNATLIASRMLCLWTCIPCLWRCCWLEFCVKFDIYQDEFHSSYYVVKMLFVQLHELMRNLLECSYMLSSTSSTQTAHITQDIVYLIAPHGLSGGLTWWLTPFQGECFSSRLPSWSPQQQRARDEATRRKWMSP